MLRFPKYFFQFSMLIYFVMIFFIQNPMVLARQSTFDSTNITYVDIKSGDLCIVCDMPIKLGAGIGILFDGRRVTLDLEHLKDFINNKERFFHKLQANVALYDEGVFDKYQISYGWFIFGMWILLALVSSAFCVNIAMKKGLNIKLWFYIGIITNLFGLIYLIFSVKKQSALLPEKFGKIVLTDSPVKCPRCEGLNHPSAEKCSACGIILNSFSESEIRRI